MSEIFLSTVAHSLKNTLESILDDKTDGIEGGLLYKKYCESVNQKDYFEDVLEMGGPGLASEKTEGAEMSTGSITEGTLTRYIVRTFGLKLIVTEETMEDSKYPEVLNLAKRLKRAMFKTQEIDAALMLQRGFNTGFAGGDGLPLWSASHTLPNGGTYSNVMATPAAPSRAAAIDAVTAVAKFPGHDGILGDNYTIEKIVCPVDQWAVWAGIINSEKAPEPGNFNEVNVIHGMGWEIIKNTYWSNTTTNYAFLTNAEGGMNFRTRRKPRSRTWVDNSLENMTYGISARWARGWSDGRSTLGVQA